MTNYNEYPNIANFGTHFNIPYNINKIEFGYEANTIDVKELTKEEITKTLIKRKYSLDDEIAILNNKESGEEKYIIEYKQYLIYRNECKILATEIINTI